LVIYIDINPYNKALVEKEINSNMLIAGTNKSSGDLEKFNASVEMLKKFNPMYEISLDLQQVNLNFTSKSIGSIGKFIEIVRIHTQGYLEFRQI
jgi:hypothetical protein